MIVRVRTVPGEHRGLTARLAALALLLVITVVGVRARGGLHLSPGPLAPHAGVLGSALGIVLVACGCGAAVLLVWLIGVPRRRHPDEQQPTAELTDPRWVRLASLLAALSAIFLPWLLLVWVAIRHRNSASGPHAAPPPAAVTTGLATPPPSTVPSPHASSAAGFPALLLVLAAALALVLMTLIAWTVRRRRLARVEPAQAPQDQHTERALGADAWTDAVQGGRRALPGGDARAGIIASYAAMERHLAASGTLREPADTPTELLERAAREKRVPAASAHRLLALFQRARFSDHPLGESDRGAAEAALEEIIAGSGGRR